MERTLETIDRLSEKEIFEINDRRILTGFDHYLIGSTPPFLNMRENPFVPQGLMDGSMTLAEIQRLRREQNFIASNSKAAELVGLEDPTKAVLVSLPDIDSLTGMAETTPVVMGIYDSLTQNVLNDEFTLRKYAFKLEQLLEFIHERRIASHRGSI